jgi:anti-anti-sigma regulatory factor/HAMP domain-containing protein
MLTKKVAIAALACLIFIAATALIAITSNLTMRNTVRQLSEQAAKQVAVNGELNYQLARAIARAQVFYYTRKETDRLDAQRLLREAQASEADFQAAEVNAEYLDQQLLSEHTAMLERRHALLDRAQREFADLEKANTDQNDVAIRRSIVALIQTDRESGQLTQDINGLLDREAAAASAGIDTLMWRGLAAVGFAFGLIALLIPVMLVLLQRKIVRPIRHLSAVLELVANGNLTRPVPVTNKDELGHLQRDFNQMLCDLQEQRDQLTQHKDMLQTRAVHLEQALAELRASVSERDQLSHAIRELSSPVIPVLDGVLIMPLIGAIDTERAQLLTQALLAATTRHSAHTVILDVTGVPIIDTQVAHALLHSAEALRLLGADAIIVGLRPELAQTIVGLGLDLSSLNAQADLRSGVEYVLKRQRRRQRIARPALA